MPSTSVAWVSRYESGTHCTAPKLVSKSSTMVGSATLTMLPSTVPRNTATPTAVITFHLWG